MSYQVWLIVFIVVQFIHGLGTWKLYAKAGEKSWSAFVPVYNAYVLMRIINREWWLVFLLFLPVINIIMFVVIWVEIARSFGKNSYLDSFLTIISLGFYTYYLNYIEDVKYVKERNINPKSTSGEWTSSLIFAIIAATLVHNYVLQPYTIPTSSLEKSLLVGDFLFVSKFHYGARIPMSTVAAPMVHDTIPFFNIKSYLKDFELPYLRLPGFQKIKNNDIVVFNWPVDTMLNMYYTDKYYYKPIDKKTNYVKRAVGIAGDTLEIKDGYVYINGEKNKLNDRAELQFSYLVQTKKDIDFNEKVIVNNYDITDPFIKINSENTYKFIAMSDKTINKFKDHPNVSSIEKDLAINGQRDSNIFPHKQNFNWNNDFFGPIYIPKAGSTIDLSIENLPLYKRVIEVYEKGGGKEKNKIKVIDNNIFINEELITDYTFQQDYYWLMGDNRHNSQDSRVWGFVPFDHVVGKPVFKWLSWDTNGKGINKIRWNRMFTTVHGEGTPISFFVPFLILLSLYFGVKKWRKYKKED
jgi:signal peptidase I